MSSYYHPAAIYGGPVPAIRQLNQVINRLGHQVTVFTTDANGRGDLEMPKGQPVLVDGLPVTYFPRWWFGQAEKPFSLFFSPALGKALRQLRPGDYDLMLVHATWGDPGRLAARAARRLGLPYFCYTHGTFEPWRMAYKKRKKQIYLALVEGNILRRAAGIVVCNEAEASYLRKLGIRTPSRRIPWGVDIKDPAEIPPYSSLTTIFPVLANRPFILFLARLHPMKGLDILIPAFADVAKDFPDWLLVVAGPDEGGYRSQVENMVAANGIIHRVLFTGLVTGDVKSALLGHTNLYVLPSYSEGFSVSVTEALSYGRPLVITDTCYVPEVAQYEAGRVVPGARPALAEALREMMSDNDLRRQCGSNAIRLAQTEFTWEAVAQKSLDFYREVLAQ
ncbi:MAG: glycosyltransferase [Desulfobacca sp.]